MRKSTLRSLLLLGGAFALLAAFAPRANADCPSCLRFYDMEAPVGVGGVGHGSHAPAIQQGEGVGPPAIDFAFSFQNNDGTPYNAGNLSGVTGQAVGTTNKPAGS